MGSISFSRPSRPACTDSAVGRPLHISSEHHKRCGVPLRPPAGERGVCHFGSFWQRKRLYSSNDHQDGILTGLSSTERDVVGCSSCKLFSISGRNSVQLTCVRQRVQVNQFRRIKRASVCLMRPVSVLHSRLTLFSHLELGIPGETQSHACLAWLSVALLSSASLFCSSVTSSASLLVWGRGEAMNF